MKTFCKSSGFHHRYSQAVVLSMSLLHGGFYLIMVSILCVASLHAQKQSGNTKSVTTEKKLVPGLTPAPFKPRLDIPTKPSGADTNDMFTVGQYGISERRSIDILGTVLKPIEDNAQTELTLTSIPEPNMCYEYCIKKFKFNVLLHAGGDKKTYELGKSAWTGICSVKVKIEGWNGTAWINVPAGSGANEKTLTLTSPTATSTGKVDELWTEDITNFHHKKCDGSATPITKLRFTVLSSSIPNAITNNVRLEVSFNEELAINVLSLNGGIKYKPNTFVKNGNTIASPSPTHKTVFVSGVNNPVAFEWDDPLNSNIQFCKDSFPEYQIQLLRLYNLEPNLPYSTTEHCIKTHIDWSQALTINTGSSHESIQLTLVEGRGYYAYRIRAIGNRYEGGANNPLNWGDWSNSPTDNSDIELGDCGGGPSFTYGVFFYEQFDNTRNWQYERGFAEAVYAGPRISETMQYTDALMNPIQKQVRSKTNQEVIVSHTVLDFNGRASLQSVPVPVNQDKVQYISQFMTSATNSNDIYHAGDFDIDETINGALVTKPPVAVNSSSLLGGYYSNNNQDVTIPNAEGFPFIRTLFARDGRIKEQSGVGLEHSIKTFGTPSKTLRKIYSGVSDKELTSIFGNEAIIDSACSKVITIDQNNVASVEYTSKEGQVIATCIIDNGILPSSLAQGGTVPTAEGNPTLLNLEGEQVNSIKIKPTTSNLNKPRITKVSTSPEVTSRSIEVLTNTGVQFTYVIKRQTFNGWCNYSADCKFIAKLKIINEENGLDITNTLGLTTPVSLPTSGSGDMVVWNTSVQIGPGQFTFSVTIEKDDTPDIPSGGFTSRIDQAVQKLITDKLKPKNLEGPNGIMETLFGSNALAPKHLEDAKTQMEVYQATYALNKNSDGVLVVPFNPESACKENIYLSEDGICDDPSGTDAFINDPATDLKVKSQKLNFERYLIDEVMKNDDAWRFLLGYKKGDPDGDRDFNEMKNDPLTRKLRLCSIDNNWIISQDYDNYKPNTTPPEQIIPKNTINRFFRNKSGDDKFPLFNAGPPITGIMPQPFVNPTGSVGNKGWGFFNYIIANMITAQYPATPASGSQTPTYALYGGEELFKVWRGVVAQYIATLNETEKGKVRGVEQTNDAGKTESVHFDLLDQFLTSARKQLCGVSNQPYGANGYLEHPYKFFNSGEFSLTRLNQCRASLDLSIPIATDCDTLYRDKLAKLYFCLNGFNMRIKRDVKGEVAEVLATMSDGCKRPNVPFNANHPAWKSFKTCMENVANTMADKCRLSCKGMEPHFNLTLLQQYSQLGKYHLVGTKRPESGVEVLATDPDAIDPKEYFCRLNLIREDCAKGCRLTVGAYLEQGIQKGYMVTGDVEAYTDRMIGYPTVAFATTTPNTPACSVGYRPIGFDGSKSTRLQQLVDYLNYIYITKTTSWYSKKTNILLSYSTLNPPKSEFRGWVDLRLEFIKAAQDMGIDIVQCFPDTARLFNEILRHYAVPGDEFRFVRTGELQSESDEECMVPYCALAVRYNEIRPKGYTNAPGQTPHYWVTELNNYYDIMWGGHTVSKPDPFLLNRQFTTNPNGAQDILGFNIFEAYHSYLGTIQGTKDETAQWMAQYLRYYMYDDHVNGKGASKSFNPFRTTTSDFIRGNSSTIYFMQGEDGDVAESDPKNILNTSIRNYYSLYQSNDNTYWGTNNGGITRNRWRAFGPLLIGFIPSFSSSEYYGFTHSLSVEAVANGIQRLCANKYWFRNDSDKMRDKIIVDNNQPNGFASIDFYRRFTNPLEGKTSTFTDTVGYFFEDKDGYLNFRDKVFNRTTQIQSVRFYETVTKSIASQCAWLCDNTSCNLCIKWSRPTENSIVAETTTVNLGSRSCAEKKLIDLKAEIARQYYAILDRWKENLRASYAQNCSPANKQDELTLEYDVRTYHYTLYYYDRAGRLVKTVPPQGVDINPSYTRNSVPNHTLVTKYGYNSVGQMVQSITPDGGLTLFWYNNNGQLRFSQNAKQAYASPETYSYTKYDVLGRITEVGEAEGSPSGFSQSTIDDVLFPTANRRHITTTVYTVPLNGLPSPYNTPEHTQRNLLNRVSYTSYQENPTSTPPSPISTSIYSYDVHGNVEWVIQDIPGLGASKIESEYNLIAGTITKVSYRKGYPDEYYIKYDYDEDNRLIAAYTSRNGELWDCDARYEYYRHGPLRRTAMGEDSVQGLDYIYTIQGWMKALNHPSQVITNDPSKDGNQISTTQTRFAQDAFSMMLGYFEGDFARTGSAYNSTGSRNGVSYTKNAHMLTNTHGLYNGNISSQVGSTLQSGGTYSLKGDVYRYDLLNRLRSNTDQAFANNVWSTTSNFANSYTYDANGNIEKLMRSKEDGVVFDELTYEYEANTNQLKQVTDSKGDAVAGYDIDNQTNASNYEYDKIGNMTKDNQEGLTITWLPSGKIESVTKVKTPENWQLRFRYDAAGRRVAKEKFTKDNAGVYAVFGKGTYYVYEASSKVLGTYEKENGITKLREVPLLGSSRLGMDRVDVIRSNTPLAVTSVYSRTVGSKSYELTDHLGNVRAVVGDIKLPSGASFMADLRSSSDYYPFGMALPARGYQSADYRYGYNGKEKDDEVKGEGNSYDYGARIYDSRVCRWLSRDAKEDKYPNISTYAYVANTPLMAIDPDGKDIIVLSAPKGANGFGHAAVLIGNDKDGWHLFSKNGTNDNRGLWGESNHEPQDWVYSRTLSEFAKDYNIDNKGDVKYTSAIRIQSSVETDNLMKEAASAAVNSDYDLTNQCCVDVCSDALKAGGFNPGYADNATTNNNSGVIVTSMKVMFKAVFDNPAEALKSLEANVPNVRYKAIVERNKGTDVTKSILPPSEMVTERKINYAEEISGKQGQEPLTPQPVKPGDEP